MTPSWPFEDPPNVAVFTTAAVIKTGHPILYVAHDDEDGAWQFHTGQDGANDAPMLVALREIVKLDPSIAELADLPYGWIATRTNPASAWVCAPRK